MPQVTAIPQLPPRPLEGHKGLFGRVLVVGGSADMIGAPVLAGTAALRMGAGLVYLAVPRTILNTAISITPELVGLGLGRGVEKKLTDAAQKCDAIILGPGLGQSADAAARVKRLLRLQKPMVIDADALNIIASGKRWPKDCRARAVLTPHPGEMARLARLMGEREVPAEEAGRIQIATRTAKAFGQVVVLKGHGTVVADGENFYVNRTGDSSLAKGGSGDVLSGMLGTLLAQEMPPFQAAILAVHMHGLAGELAGAKLGQRCVLARDVIDFIPLAVVAAAAAAADPRAKMS